MKKNIIFIISALLLNNIAYSHSQLVNADPVNFSYIKKLNNIKLEFNEVITLSKFELFDSKFKNIEILIKSSESQVIDINIPKIKNNEIYSYRYAIISADGHPISGSGVFILGNKKFTAKNYNINFFDYDFIIKRSSNGLYNIKVPTNIISIELRNKSLRAPIIVSKKNKENFSFMIPLNGEWEMTLVKELDKFNIIRENKLININ
jgi:methionine-rich copper-binding protein CopC